MGTRPSKESTIQFWLPDPDDIARVLHLLEICGYSNRNMAFDEATQSGESNTVFEVTIKRRSISQTETWRDEMILSEYIHEGIGQA